MNKQENTENFRVPANWYCIGLTVNISRSTVTATSVRSDAIHEACSNTVAIISKEDSLDESPDDNTAGDSPGVVVDELSVLAIMTKISMTRPTNASVMDKFKIRMVEPKDKEIQSIIITVDNGLFQKKSCTTPVEDIIFFKVDPLDF